MQNEEEIALKFKSENVFTGNKIKSYRLKRKWMQSDLAERIGVKGNTISAYERGAVEIPHSKLKAVAEALEVRTSDLLPIEDSENNDTISEYIQEVKSKYTTDQLNFLEQLIEKSLSLNESEREDFLKNIKFAVEFFNKK